MKATIQFKLAEDKYVPFSQNSNASVQEFVNWIIDDIQYCIETVDELIDISNKTISNNNFEHYDDDGNAHHLNIQKDIVTIENDFNNTKVNLETSEFLKFLSQYRDFLLDKNQIFETGIVILFCN